MIDLAVAIRMEADCWYWCRAKRRNGDYCDPTDPGIRYAYAKAFYPRAYDKWITRRRDEWRDYRTQKWSAHAVD